jgi:germination protein M
MHRDYNNRTRLMVTASLLLIFSLIVSGCGLFGPEPSRQTSANNSLSQSDAIKVQAGDKTEQQGQENLTTTSDKTPQDNQFSATLYLEDSNGYVVPWQMTLPRDGEHFAQQTLRYMVKGGPVEAMLPEGFSAVIPEGTNILGMTIKDGLATVDFSPQFKKYPADQEEKIVQAITWALTEFDTIRKVQFWVNGYPLEAMPVNGTPVQNVGREVGINLEWKDNIVMGQTTPVILYFQGAASPSGQNYFVPVTRLIPQTDDVPTATIEQLIDGPKTGSHLFSPLLSSTGVNSVKVAGDLAVVDLGKEFLQYNTGQASTDAVQAIVLSLTDNTSAKQVQIKVDGGATVAGSSGADYSKPVTRPPSINPV